MVGPSCYLCGDGPYITVLDQKAINVWTNAGDGVSRAVRMPCVLRQCRCCGHIYQPLNDVLRDALREIYSSTQAKLSTSMGKGNWGVERGQDFLKIFLGMVNIKDHDSVLEIGCDDGYLLKAIKDRGGRNLAGIEPSLAATLEVEGITLMKGFAQEDLVLSRQYSLIFASSVFEHIEDMNGIMRFCVKNLKPGGELYFSVPNAGKYIDEGDPALFTHQHVQYFTEHSVRWLLGRYGFKVKAVVKDKDSLEVLGQLTGSAASSSPEVLLRTDYEQKLALVLAKVRQILEKPSVIVHAANNALNNILGWIDKDFDFTLVDNDATKHGKRYFGKVVRSLDSLALDRYATVLIVPNAFRAAIRASYQQRHFSGAIEDLSV